MFCPVLEMFCPRMCCPIQPKNVSFIDEKGIKNVKNRGKHLDIRVKLSQHLEHVIALQHFKNALCLENTLRKWSTQNKRKKREKTEHRTVVDQQLIQKLFHMLKVY